MPPFNRSSLIYTAAQTEVAGAAGDDTPQMLARAGNSLDAVCQSWNRKRWKWLQDEQIIALIAPFTVTGCTTTVDSATVTTSVSNGFLSVLVDDVVSGGGVRSESLVSSTGATAIGLGAAASATVTGATLTFNRALYTVSADYKMVFDVRLLGSSQPLYYQPRREYDRSVVDQTSSGGTYGYDLYPIGKKGKLRLLSPPGAGTLMVKYYRRMVMPSQTAALGLDLPEDFEDVFIAAAKSHFLADKGQAYQPQLAYWSTYAIEGMKEMRRDERLVEDEDLALQPPSPRRIYGPNSPFYWER